MMATFHSCVSRAEFDCERTRAVYAEAKYDALVIQIDRLRAALLAAKRGHTSLCGTQQSTYPYHCTCGADAHNLAIAKALGEK